MEINHAELPSAKIEQCPEVVFVSCVCTRAYTHTHTLIWEDKKSTLSFLEEKNKTKLN